jgi:hypothetical protein
MKTRLLALDTETKQFRLITPAEAEAHDVTVCMPWSDPLILPDNARGGCALCGIALQFRPDAPRRPMKLCLECAAACARPN